MAVVPPPGHAPGPQQGTRWAQGLPPNPREPGGQPATGREGQQPAVPPPSSPSRPGAGPGRPAQVTPASGVACWNTHADTRCFRPAWGAVEVVFALFQLLLVSADTGHCSTGTK